MNKGAIVATVAVIGYLSFELYAVKRNQYRTEPLYILGEFTAARRATERCGDPDVAQQTAFERNFDAVTRRARADVVKTYPDRSADEVDKLLADLMSERGQEIDGLVAAAGCEDQTVWRWVKLHEARARLNLR